MDLKFFLSNWNLVLMVIGFCSLVGLAVFIERLIVLYRSSIDTHAFLIQLRQAIEKESIVEAMQICEKTKGMIARIVKAGLARHHRGREQIENAMEMAGLIEVADLEKNAKILSVIAHTAPLIGLLGTVLGFIQAFSEMRASGLMDLSATRIGEAMEYALITTAAGLVVAIPATLAYNYVVSRIQSLVMDAQMTSSEVVDLLVYRDDAF